jgi:hypothetical protein
MPLPVNPSFQNVGTEYTPVINNALGNGGRIAGASGTSELESKMSDLSGAPGSNLNYIANSNPSNYANRSGVDTVAASSGGGSGGGGGSAGGGGSGSSSLDEALGLIGTGIALISGIKAIGSGIQSAISGIQEAAGQVDNLLSKVRAKNLPSGGEVYKEVSRTQVRSVVDLDWRIRLNFDFTKVFGSKIFEPLGKTSGLVWPFIPRVSIGYRANYSSVEPVHNNFPFQAYKNSAVDDVQISGEFSVQTADDAAYWIAATHFLKTATKMFYGTGNAELTGNPPIICRLSGYSSFVFNDVPVVIKSYQVELPEDVDYINVVLNGTNHWVPTLSTVSVTVAPVYNRERLRKFSLKDFAKGGELSKGIM